MRGRRVLVPRPIYDLSTHIKINRSGHENRVVGEPLVFVGKKVEVLNFRIE